MVRDFFGRLQWRVESWQQPDEEAPWSLRGQYTELLAAVRFLSILPFPGSALLFQSEDDEPRLIIGSGYFSLVGTLLGLLLMLLPLLLGRLLPMSVLAALLVVVQVVLTGGLHLDGLMDSCDGLFGGKDRASKLEIMHDSRVGSFGVLGAGCLLLLKFALFSSLPMKELPLILLTVLPVGRWTMVLVMRLFPSARPNGLGAAVRQTVTPTRLLLAGVLSLVVAFCCGQFVGLLIWCAGSLVAVLIGLGIMRSIDGLTGDSYGAIEELTEVFCLFLFVLFWH